MLEHLSIKNFALIENCEISFDKGLNIITGETGAGKSIIIQAATILLGGRASVENIRSGMEEAVLNAVINVSDQNELKEHLKETGITIEEDEIILRRILTASGKSRSFINGVQVTSKELNIVSSSLFDFHGQHDGISLLKKKTHMKYLDDYIHIENDLTLLKEIYDELKKTRESLQFLEEADKDKEHRLELLDHEINEIESSSIKDGEDEKLNKEIKIYENIEKLMTSLENVHSSFSGENGLNSNLRNVKNILSHVSEMDDSFNNISNDVSDIFYRLEDIAQEVATKRGQYQFEPGKLDELIERSETIEKLKRKYGGSIQAVNEYLEKSRSELELITFSSQEKEKLLQKLKELENDFITNSMKISDKRREGSIILQERVKKELLQLGMNDVEFEIMIEHKVADDQTDVIEYGGKNYKYNEKGIDDIEYLISPNKGEPLKSLIKIASGGELSRIVLALKSVLVEKDSVTTMIFDEIDAGIGGKVALAVARTLKTLGGHKQIICITHLPQIASAGSRNFLILKDVVNERTITTIEHVSEEKKVNEIARMLSGQITDVSLDHAKELIISMQRIDS